MIKIISNIISKLNTSSNEHIFSKVFYPYELKESRLNGITEFNTKSKIILKKKKLNRFNTNKSILFKVFVPNSFLLSKSLENPNIKSEVITKKINEKNSKIK